MKRLVLFLLATGLAATFGSAAVAAPIESFDGPVATGNSQAPGVWYTDRYAPAGFVGGQVAPDGRTGTLQQSISAADFSRPVPYNGAFYNTQGRKFDTPGLTSAFIEMYIPGSWDALAQNVPGSEGRLGGLWATGVDASNVTRDFPIIEFNNQLDSFRVWDPEAGGTGYQLVSGFAGYDRWYEIGFQINGSSIEYFINGILVYTDSTLAGTTQFSNLILQGYNAGNDYSIYWDNLQTESAMVPEPASLAIWSLIGVAGAAGAWRRKRKLTSAN
jgi:hypothetical protein